MADFAPASIPATEVRVLPSAVANQDYRISVALPFRYEEHPDRTYPVIYLLDANLYFGMVVDMVRAMNIRVSICDELPDAIIVGIGYPVSGTLLEQLHQVMHLRLRDFMSMRNADGEQFIQAHFPLPEPIVSGNAGPFLHFIQHELVPLIESEYRANPADRTLMGHSWGAGFAVYTMFQQPQLFQRYVLASGDINPEWGQAYAEHHHNLPVRMHIANEDPAADGEELARLASDAEMMERRQYADFKLTYQVIPGCKHCAVVPPAFQAGLVAVFS